MADWIERYDLAGREHRLRVSDRSPLVGKTLGELDLRSVTGAHLIAIERQRGYATDVIAPTKKTAFAAGDVLLVDLSAPKIDVEALAAPVRAGAAAARPAPTSATGRRRSAWRR